MKWIEVTTHPHKKDVLLCLGPGSRIERSKLNPSGAVVFPTPHEAAIEVADKYEDMRAEVFNTEATQWP